MTPRALKPLCALENRARTDNLLAASKRAMKGKRYRPDVQAWAMREEAEVLAMREELLSGAWQPGPYHSEISREGNTTGLRRAYMRWPLDPRPACGRRRCHTPGAAGCLVQQQRLPLCAGRAKSLAVAEAFSATQKLSIHAPASWSATTEMRGRSRASVAPLSNVLWLSSALLAIAKRCRVSLATRTPKRSRAFARCISPFRHSAFVIHSSF